VGLLSVFASHKIRWPESAHSGCDGPASSLPVIAGSRHFIDHDTRIKVVIAVQLFYYE